MARAKSAAQKRVEVEVTLTDAEMAYQEDMQRRLAATLAERQREMIVEGVQDAAKALRRLADTLDSHVTRFPDSEKYHGPAEAALDLIQSAQHDVLWAIPNMHLDSLLTTLHRYQDALAAVAEVDAGLKPIQRVQKRWVDA